MQGIREREREREKEEETNRAFNSVTDFFFLSNQFRHVFVCETVVEGWVGEEGGSLRRKKQTQNSVRTMCEIQENLDYGGQKNCAEEMGTK
jgi:hypothetical protein